MPNTAPSPLLMQKIINPQVPQANAVPQSVQQPMPPGNINTAPSPNIIQQLLQMLLQRQSPNQLQPPQAITGVRG